MVEIFGEYYYLDIDKITERCELEVTPITNDNDEPLQVEQTINVFKYDAVKYCIDTLLTENVQDDDKMGLFNSELTISFKLAFNTLIKYGILVKYE